MRKDVIRLKKGWLGLGIVVAVIVIFGLMFMSSYNSFVNLEEDVNNTDVDVDGLTAGISISVYL